MSGPECSHWCHNTERGRVHKQTAALSDSHDAAITHFVQACEPQHITFYGSCSPESCDFRFNTGKGEWNAHASREQCIVGTGHYVSTSLRRHPGRFANGLALWVRDKRDASKHRTCTLVRATGNRCSEPIYVIALSSEVWGSFISNTQATTIAAFTAPGYTLTSASWTSFRQEYMFAYYNPLESSSTPRVRINTVVDQGPRDIRTVRR